MKMFYKKFELLHFENKAAILLTKVIEVRRLWVFKSQKTLKGLVNLYMWKFDRKLSFNTSYKKIEWNTPDQYWEYPSKIEPYWEAAKKGFPEESQIVDSVVIYDTTEKDESYYRSLTRQALQLESEGKTEEAMELFKKIEKS